MSGSMALGGVSKSLRNMLMSEMTSKVPVTLQRPDDPGPDQQRLNLFLHRVEEHPQLRNAGYRLKPGTTGTLLGPPLALVLRYVLTAYAASHAEYGNADAHAILGDAMRVFHQTPEVPAEHLDDTLADARERLCVMLVPLSTDDIFQLWNTFKEPYELSVQYEVSVVELDTGAAAALAPRVRTIGTPEVRAPYEPPQILDVQPRSGPTGTVLTISGAHLRGWTATAAISGVEVATAVKLEADALDVTVPARLQPGFHQLRVDVSRLARACFFFEVIPT